MHMILVYQLRIFKRVRFATFKPENMRSDCANLTICWLRLAHNIPEPPLPIWGHSTVEGIEALCPGNHPGASSSMTSSRTDPTANRRSIWAPDHVFDVKMLTSFMPYLLLWPVACLKPPFYHRYMAPWNHCNTGICTTT